MDFKKIEQKWQKKWEESKCFEVKVDSKKKKFYNLEMFPYPSGEGLHIGHALNYTIGDIRARFKRMNEVNVLYPMGYDSFGLPAENAAIKAKTHPRDYTRDSINNFIKQQKALGLSYDWDKILSSCEPEYYKWNQKFFIEFFKKGLAYKKKSPVNWCPKCETVLANEQVHNGRCWRHEDTEVEIKHLEQWFIKTTEYADELLDCIDDLNWPERIKIMQKNWIGKSEGAELIFEIDGTKEKFPIFTTRPDTIYGVTFMVISAQHSRLMEFVTADQEKEVKKFLKKLNSVSEKALHQSKAPLGVPQMEEYWGKEGVFTGSYAVNPINGTKVPIWAGNFVVANYGSGMVMAVPAHDQRDFDFAKKYGIDIKPVITVKDPLDFKNLPKGDMAYTRPGILMHSKEFNGLDNEKAKDEIVNHLKKKKLAKKTIQFKMRDWLISRQRYWGTPIPIIYCNECGAVPVPEKDLPVELPYDVKFGKGNPLLTNNDFVNCKCPKCGGNATRETDTMDTFVDSSWYYMRYPDNKNLKEAFDKKKVDYWLPVDCYIGGAEHATMHLLYARFWTKALRDLGYVKFDEPFTQLFNQGMLHAADGKKMSKSLGNVVNPLDVIGKYGADSLRFTLVSFASPDSDTNWDENVLIGNNRFLTKVFDKISGIKVGKSGEKMESKLNKAIKEVSSDIEKFKYNLAVIKIRDLFNALGAEESKDVLEKSLKLLHPFCPHITEELWEKIGGSGLITISKWPVADEKKINEKFEKEDEAVDKLVSDIVNISKFVEGRRSAYPKLRSKGAKDKVYVYVLPNELDNYKDNLGEISKRTGKDVIIYSVSDKDKHDPENKSKKVKPGRPGIYFE